MPICSRCTGFYLGIFCGLLFLFIHFLAFSYFQLIILTIIAMIPMALDGFTQLVGLRKSSNLTRLLTGLFCGFFIGIDIYLILWFILA
jgi:uncharacterized membrane protein